MKKRVILLVLLLIPLVSAQILNLPDPPPIPNSDNDQLTQNTTNVTIPATSNLEQRIIALERLEIESRLIIIESQLAALAGINSRLDDLQQQINSLRNEARPSLEQPASFDALMELRSQLSSWFKWSISIAVLALLGVLGIVGTNVFKRISMNEQTKQEIQKYLSTYLTQGYPLESIKEQLRNSGWDPKLVDAAVKELGRGLPK